MKCRLIVDVDGTLCPVKKEGENYSDLVPNFEIIKKLRTLKHEGAEIVIFSSRNMRTYSGNLGLINAKTLPLLIEWLNKWQIPFDEILVGKPWPGNMGFYIDDRAVRPKEFSKYSMEELNKICEQDRTK